MRLICPLNVALVIFASTGPAPAQIGGLLMAMRVRGETVEEFDDRAAGGDLVVEDDRVATGDVADDGVDHDTVVGDAALGACGDRQAEQPLAGSRGPGVAAERHDELAARLGSRVVNALSTLGSKAAQRNNER